MFARRSASRRDGRWHLFKLIPGFERNPTLACKVNYAQAFLRLLFNRSEHPSRKLRTQRRGWRCGRSIYPGLSLAKNGAAQNYAQAAYWYLKGLDKITLGFNSISASCTPLARECRAMMPSH